MLLLIHSEYIFLSVKSEAVNVITSIARYYLGTVLAQF